MKKLGHSRAFLLEMVFVLLFLSLSSAVIVQLFWAAHMSAQRSAEQTAAMTQGQAAVEQWKAARADDDAAFPEADGWLPASTGSARTVYYNDAWEKTHAGDAAYRLEVAIRREDTPGGALCRAEACVTRLADDAELCRIPAACYVPGEVARG